MYGFVSVSQELTNTLIYRNMLLPRTFTFHVSIKLVYFIFANYSSIILFRRRTLEAPYWLIEAESRIFAPVEETSILGWWVSYFTPLLMIDVIIYQRWF